MAACNTTRLVLSLVCSVGAAVLLEYHGMIQIARTASALVLWTREAVIPVYP